MGDLGDETRERTDRELADEEAEVLLRSQVAIERLRPEVTDEATYEHLLVAVREATSHNESAAQFKARIERLGETGLAVAREILDKLP